MDMEPKRFLDVELDYNGPTSCSPKKPADWDWKGIIINAPKKVWFKLGEKVPPYNAFVAVPICGYHIVEVRPDLAGRDNKILVAIERATGKKFSGPIIPLDPSPIVPPPSSPSLTVRETKGMTAGGYFNANLADYVKLPQSSAAYDVHMEFREYKSNVVTVELILMEDVN